jgi:hypothetical protein
LKGGQRRKLVRKIELVKAAVLAAASEVVIGEVNPEIDGNHTHFIENHAFPIFPGGTHFHLGINYGWITQGRGQGS